MFTPLERQVIAYAEAMTATPARVTDEMAEGSSPAWAAVMELTKMVAVENERSRPTVRWG